MEFYLGAPSPSWLYRSPAPLMLSRRVLQTQKSWKRATTPWVLDSGGFTELTLNGKWELPTGRYINMVRRYMSEIGMLRWAAPQDWMCEPHMLKLTGHTVDRHQRNTVSNYLRLLTYGPEIPWVPVLQGWTLEDYTNCIDLYQAEGVDLASLPTVALGSVCRRDDVSFIYSLLLRLRDRGITRVHGFGITSKALKHSSFQSTDPMAWSMSASYRKLKLPWCTHKLCTKCLDFALIWRARLLLKCDLEDDVTLPEASMCYVTGKLP